MEIVRPIGDQPIPPHARRVFKGVIFDVYQWEQKMYDGTKKTFEKLRRPDTVIIFGVLPDGRILLTEQEQPGIKNYIGATGGRVDENESVLEAVKREFLEETGYEAEEYFLWDAQQPVGKIDWAVFTFIAKGLKKVAEPDLDGGEKIVFKPVSFDEFLDLATNERFYEKEVVSRMFEAKLYPEKKEELRRLFSLSD